MAKRKSKTSAIRRAVLVIDALAAEPGSLSLSELARRTGLPKSSLSDVGGALEAAHFALRDGDGDLSLGFGFVELAAAFVAGTPLIERFMALAEPPPGTEGEAILLSVLQNSDVVYLCRREGSMPLPLTFKPGMRLPAWRTASGRLLLSSSEARTPAQLSARLGGTSHLLDGAEPDWDDLARELTAVRESGYSISDEGSVRGMLSIAAPVVPEPEGKAIASVSVPMLKESVDDARLQLMVDAVSGLARTLSAALAMDLGAPGVSES